MPALRTCIWLDADAEEATRLYASILPGSSADAVLRGAFDWPGGSAGDVLMVDVTLIG